MTRPGHAVFAGSMGALGVLSLISGDFAYNWQPVPEWLPWRQPLAYMSGALLLASALGILWKRATTAAGFILAANLAVWLLLLHLPRIVGQPVNGSAWLGFAEALVLVAGAWLILAGALPRRLGDIEAERVAQLVFGAALPLIGQSHFVYVEGAAAFVPDWLPHRPAIALVTGAAHAAAGFAIVIGFMPRLAAVLETVMMAGFTLLVWVPAVAAAPGGMHAWTALFVSAALTGSAWTIAHTYAANAAEPRLRESRTPR